MQEHGSRAVGCAARCRRRRWGGKTSQRCSARPPGTRRRHVALSGRGGARLLRVVCRRGGVGAQDGSQHRLGEEWTRGAAGQQITMVSYLQIGARLRLEGRSSAERRREGIEFRWRRKPTHDLFVGEWRERGQSFSRAIRFSWRDKMEGINGATTKNVRKKILRPKKMEGEQNNLSSFFFEGKIWKIT